MGDFLGKVGNDVLSCHDASRHYQKTLCMAFSRLTFRDTSGSCFERTPPLQMAQIKTKKDGALTKGGMVYAGRR